MSESDAGSTNPRSVLISIASDSFLHTIDPAVAQGAPSHAEAAGEAAGEAEGGRSRQSDMT